MGMSDVNRSASRMTSAESTQAASTAAPSTTEPRPARYQRPLLRSHGPVGEITAKSGEKVTIEVKYTDTSDVDAKENIVAVVWH
jgi:hypothetical protein